jgi:hypothetical protein
MRVHGPRPTFGPRSPGKTKEFMDSTTCRARHYAGKEYEHLHDVGDGHEAGRGGTGPAAPSGHRCAAGSRAEAFAVLQLDHGAAERSLSRYRGVGALSDPGRRRPTAGSAITSRSAPLRGAAWLARRHRRRHQSQRTRPTSGTNRAIAPALPLADSYTFRRACRGSAA